MDGTTYNKLMNKLYLGDNTMNTYKYEYTDTFAGERNYCWVKRGEVKAKNLKQAMKLARAAIGMTGFKGDFSDCSDFVEWKPRGMCTILTVEEIES